MENKPNTLQEAIQIIESINEKINSFSAKCDSFEAENLSLRKRQDDSSSEIFALKTSLEAEQKISSSLKQKLENSEAENASLKTQLSDIKNKYDSLMQKDMDLESRASEMAAKIAGESGTKTPIESTPESDELTIEEIASQVSKANGREKARLMDKYGDKISEYLKK